MRFYKPHHFVFYPVSLILLIYSLYKCIKGAIDGAADVSIWFVFSAIIILIIWLSWMMRQHYALTLQDRLIVSEVKNRYFQLTGSSIDALPYDFKDSQLFALRFAGNDEFIALVDKTIFENLPANEIKKLIKDWKADDRRV